MDWKEWTGLEDLHAKLMQKYPTDGCPDLEKLPQPVDWDAVYYSCIASIDDLGAVILSVGETENDCRKDATAYFLSDCHSMPTVQRMMKYIPKIKLGESLVLTASKGDVMLSVCYCDARTYLTFKRFGDKYLLRAMFDTDKKENYIRYCGIIEGGKNDIRGYF